MLVPWFLRCSPLDFERRRELCVVFDLLKIFNYTSFGGPWPSNQRSGHVILGGWQSSVSPQMKLPHDWLLYIFLYNICIDTHTDGADHYPFESWLGRRNSRRLTTNFISWLPVKIVVSLYMMAVSQFSRPCLYASLCVGIKSRERPNAENPLGR